MTALRDMVLDGWATCDFTARELADKFAEGAYGRVQSILERARIDGDPRAIARREHGDAMRRKKKEAKKPRPFDNKRLAESMGIAKGPTIEKLCYGYFGAGRIQKITLSAGNIRQGQLPLGPV